MDLINVIASIGMAVVPLIIAVVSAIHFIVRRETGGLRSEVAAVRHQLDEHDERHDREQREVSRALKRQNLDPPDGWNGPSHAATRVTGQGP